MLNKSNAARLRIVTISDIAFEGNLIVNKQVSACICSPLIMPIRQMNKPDIKILPAEVAVKNTFKEAETVDLSEFIIYA